MTPSPATDLTATDFAPSSDEIAQCASELWNESGRPEGRDDAIWLEAERRLISHQRMPEVTAMILQALGGQRPSD